ncbi:MAG: WYL domain-containing protein [Kiritimatiellae bacterium]|jgi:hypothetical protein|nr:WYL domain-containing protein [Kiritimatiellia bacterium]
MIINWAGNVQRFHAGAEGGGAQAGFFERLEIIQARYQAFDGRKSECRLHPYHLLAFHGNWYLLAHNEEKDRMATFALSRFRDIGGIGTTFLRSPDFDAKAYAREAFGITRGEKTLRVRLLFEPKLAVYIMEREWHPSQTFTRRSDGWVEMRMETIGLAGTHPLGVVLDAGRTGTCAEKPERPDRREAPGWTCTAKRSRRSFNQQLQRTSR